VAGKGLAFVSTIYLARVLGKSDYGLLSFATAIMTYGMLLTDFGLSTYGIREIASRRSDLGKCIDDVQCTRVTLSIILFALGSIAALLFVHDRRLQLLLIFSLVVMVPYALGVDWAFRALEKMGYSAFGNVLQQVVSLAPVLLFVKGPGQLLNVQIYKAVSWLVASLTLIFILKRSVGHAGFSISSRLPSLKTIKGMLKVGIPLAAAYLMAQVYLNIDTVILGIIGKPAAVGVYSAGYRVVNLANCFSYPITVAFYPSLSYDFRHNFLRYRMKLAKMVGIVLVAGVLGTLGTYFLRHMIISRLYGPGYEGAELALSVLCLAILGDFLIAGLIIAFISAGFERLTLLAVASGAVSNIILNIVLIPRYSFMGAAVATVISYGLMVLLYLANLHRIIQRGHHEGTEAQAL
jgi:O-antigen/teichoic acid export membrane protein